MPERAEGPFSDPSRGDDQQWFRDTLGRLEAQQEMLGRAVAELTTQLAEVARAEAILRRAGAPSPAPAAPGPRRDRFLRVI